jgi:hypothetical protein
VKRLLAALAGLLGLAWWRRRRIPAAVPPAPSAPDPAERLRAKLAESRGTDEQREQPEPEPEPPDVETRRREVHERARRQIDERS